jgi:transposase
LLGVEQWAEIRRMRHVERLSQREIHRRSGVHRDTIRRALASPEPPSYGPRSKRPSKLDPFLGAVAELLADEPTMSGGRIREELEGLGYVGGKTILYDLLRELQPRFLPPPRSFQRTRYRPGELAQFDLCEPRSEIPVGHGTDPPRLRRDLRAALLARLRRRAGVLEGVLRHRLRDGALSGPARRPARQAGLGPRGRDRPAGAPDRGLPRLLRPARARLGRLDAGDCQAKGALERSHRFLHSNFEAGRRFANPLDFQHRLDRWCERINARVHRTTRAVVSERLAEERKRMRPLPGVLPDTDRRFVTRVAPQPYLRFDRNDYSLDPRLVGRRVEVRASQTELTAVCLDAGELACRHRRCFAGGLTVTDPAQQAELDRRRGERKRGGREPDVERRPLTRYDELIPA